MRALTLLALLGLAGCAGGAMFIDQVESGRAVLLDESGAVHVVPASELPPDAGEGDWIGSPAESPARLAALRKQLGASDDGRDLTLP